MPLPNAGEIFLLMLLAVIILGPRQLPVYAAKLGQLVRQLRDLADQAKGQIKEELGPGFDDIDWRQLDPRQYDPRRIVREALATPSGAPTRPAAVRSGPGGTASAPTAPSAGAGGYGGAPAGMRVFDPSVPVPWDEDAT